MIHYYTNFLNVNHTLTGWYHWNNIMQQNLELFLCAKAHKKQESNKNIKIYEKYRPFIKWYKL